MLGISRLERRHSESGCHIGCYSVVILEMCSWRGDTGYDCFVSSDFLKSSHLWLWFLPSTINTIPDSFPEGVPQSLMDCCFSACFFPTSLNVCTCLHLSGAWHHWPTCELPSTSVPHPVLSLGECSIRYEGWRWFIRNTSSSQTGPKQTGESTLLAEEGIKAYQGLLAKENRMFLSFKSSRSNLVTRWQVQVVCLGDDPRTHK